MQFDEDQAPLFLERWESDGQELSFEFVGGPLLSGDAAVLGQILEHSLSTQLFGGASQSEVRRLDDHLEVTRLFPKRRQVLVAQPVPHGDDPVELWIFFSSHPRDGHDPGRGHIPLHLPLIQGEPASVVEFDCEPVVGVPPGDDAGGVGPQAEPFGATGDHDGHEGA